MAASRLQPEPASCARLEDELSKLLRKSSRPGACSATVRAPLRMAAPSRWISHDFPTTKRSPCAERASGRSPPIRQTPTCGGVFGSSSAAASPRPL